VNATQPNAAVCWFDLTFPASNALPRELRLKVSKRQLFVWMSAPDTTQPLSYASGYLKDCRIEHFAQRHSLWLNTTNFELNADEAKQVTTLLDAQPKEIEP